MLEKLSLKFELVIVRKQKENLIASGDGTSESHASLTIQLTSILKQIKSDRRRKQKRIF